MAIKRIYEVTFLGRASRWDSDREFSVLIRAVNVPAAARACRPAVKRKNPKSRFTRVIKVAEHGTPVN